ncbi:tubulin polyglutamylase complex subunit 2-like isoform X1 [Ciona intestinalis]
MAQLGVEELIERLTLGVATTLEKRPGVSDVSLSKFPQAERHILVGWEQRNSCILPDDLKSFYLTTNGLLLTWKVNINDTKVPVGEMKINSINELTKLSHAGSTATMGSNVTIADVEHEGDDEPHFDGRSRIFELDACNGVGKVCLVYMKAVPGLPAQNAEIWFLDRSLCWSHLSTNFTTYYRLMLMHMGLPQWYYSCTDVGLSPKAKQWCNLYAPVRLGLDENEVTQDEVEMPTVKVDLTRAFKGKVLDKAAKGKLTNQPNVKKKPNVPSIAGSKSLTSMRHIRGSKPWT